MGVTKFDILQANAYLGAMFPSRGKDIFVLPSSGKDGNDGLSPYTAVKTLPAALALATANRNDRVWHISEGNSAAQPIRLHAIITVNQALSSGRATKLSAVWSHPRVCKSHRPDS